MIVGRGAQTFMIQVSDHPGAGSQLPLKDASESWRTVYHGPLQVVTAREMVDVLTKKHRHVRAFRGAGVGKLWCAVLSQGNGVL